MYSDSVSVIDGITDKVVAGITLQINPFNSGYIECNGLKAPISQYFYIYSGTTCIAKPNKGFEFQSWEETFNGVSNQLIQSSTSASTISEDIADSLHNIVNYLGIGNFFGTSNSNTEATLNVTKFGTFIANFKEPPPPVPPEFLIQTYVLVGTVIAGLSIPSIVGWIKSTRDARKLNYYHTKIASLYGDDGKLDENDIEPLNRLRSSILDAYSKGKINEKHYESLKNETSILYEKIFRNRL